MKKKFAVISAMLLALALPMTAVAWESPTGDVKAETITYTAPTGAVVKAAAACNGTGALVIEGTSEVKAENAEVPEGFSEVASFVVTKEGDVEAPFQFAYNLGAEYANAEVVVYIEHEEEGVENEVRELTASADGTVTFTTDALSVHTIVAKKSDVAANTDTGSKSPQTGINSSVVAFGTAAAAVAAAGAIVALRKKVVE